MIRLVSIAEFVQDQLEGWNESRGLYVAHASCVLVGIEESNMLLHSLAFLKRPSETLVEKL